MSDSLKLSPRQIDRLRFLLAEQLNVPSDVVHHKLLRANDQIDEFDRHLSEGRPAALISRTAREEMQSAYSVETSQGVVALDLLNDLSWETRACAYSLDPGVVVRLADGEEGCRVQKLFRAIADEASPFSPGSHFFPAPAVQDEDLGSVLFTMVAHAQDDPDCLRPLGYLSVEYSFHRMNDLLKEWGEFPDQPENKFILSMSIHRIYVHPEARGLGYGSRMAYALNAAIRAGLQDLIETVKLLDKPILTASVHADILADEAASIINKIVGELNEIKEELDALIADESNEENLSFQRISVG